MAIGTITFNRMGDVMLALDEAEKAGIRPTRIQLQKFVYLADVLGQIVGVFKPREGHKTYRNGPYDPAIQNAVDSLAFRGLARIAGTWRTPSGHLGTSYKLTEAGQEFLKKIHASPTLVNKTQVAMLVGGKLSALGWDRIVGLVYAEPTFVATRPNGWGMELKSADGVTVSTAFIIAVMRRVVSTLSAESEASPEWLTDRFFAYLDDYDRHYGDNGKTEK